MTAVPGSPTKHPFRTATLVIGGAVTAAGALALGAATLAGLSYANATGDTTAIPASVHRLVVQAHGATGVLIGPTGVASISPSGEVVSPTVSGTASFRMSGGGFMLWSALPEASTNIDGDTMTIVVDDTGRIRPDWSQLQIDPGGSHWTSIEVDSDGPDASVVVNASAESFDLTNTSDHNPVVLTPIGPMPSVIRLSGALANVELPRGTTVSMDLPAGCGTQEVPDTANAPTRIVAASPYYCPTVYWTPTR